jgi:thiol-disulfide isomerase/thioredoxin
MSGYYSKWPTTSSLHIISFVKFCCVALVLGVLVSFAAASELKKLNDDEIRSLRTHNSAVCINFWATWCEPCRAEIPILNRLQKKYPKIEFIGVNVDDPENRGAIPGFLKKYPMDYKLFIRDGRNFEKLARTFHPDWKAGVPATFIYQRGKQTFAKLGPVEEEELNSVLQLNYN